jgi:hypothetical protein
MGGCGTGTRRRLVTGGRSPDIASLFMVVSLSAALWLLFDGLIIDNHLSEVKLMLL